MSHFDTEAFSKQGNFEVAEYMVRSLDGTAHDALYAVPGSGVAYKRGHWKVQSAESSIDYDQLYVSCFAARDELIAAVNTYCKKRKLPSLDLETSNSWSTVEESLAAACETLETLANSDKTLTGISGRLKGAYRKLCEYAGVGATLSSLIPDEFMCSGTLRGGLKMIFEALQQSHLYGEEVYRVLEDIPFIINQHAPYIDMYRKDRDLHVFNSSLHASIFRLLQLLLSWFSDSKALATMKMGLNPKRFSERSKERNADVKIAESRFEKHASLLRNKETREFQQETSAELHRLDRKWSESERIKESWARLDVLEKFALFLQQNPEVFEGRMPDKYRSISPDPRQAIVDAENVRQLILTKYGYDPSLMRNDCVSLLKVRGQLARDELDQERIAAIRGNPRLLAWLILDQPSMLLLEGGAERPTNNETSFLAARIVEGALESRDQKSDARVIPLAFFCGCHRRGSYGTVTQLAMSLLLTLVDTYRDVDATTLQECLEGIDDQDIGSIFDSFEKLILRLPTSTIVLLVIDGLRCFSQPLTRGREMHEATARLVSIFRRRPQAILKFLFTSPSRSDPIHSLLSDDEILNIPRDLPSRGGHSSSKWQAKIDFNEM